MAYDAAKQLGGYPLKNKKVDYNGDVSSPTKNIPWERHHWEFDATSQAYRMRHNMPSRVSELSDQQIKGLVDHLYQRFGSDKDGLTRQVIEDIIYKNDAHGLVAGGKIKSGPK